MSDNKRTWKKIESTEEITEDELAIKNHNLQVDNFKIQVIASIATVFMACLTLCTLLEMKTERDNAYRPEIVITPGIFEGGLDKEDYKDYIPINYSDKDPAILPRDVPMENARFVYIEKPYLTLKNIGQGTAKDVKVTFSTDWINSAIEALNENGSKRNAFFVEEDEFGDLGYNYIYYNTPLNPDTPYFLTTNEETTKNITFIAPGEESVKVTIPDNWCHLLAAFYNRNFQLSGPSEPLMGSKVDFIIPDLVITIECSDIQGNNHKSNEITVPWTGHFTYKKTSADRDAELESLYLWTGFYEDYVK